MKRNSKKTFFELKVTFYFDLFNFWIGGYYDYKNKAVHLALIPTLIVKLENTRPKPIIEKVSNKAVDNYIAKVKGKKAKK